MNSIVLRTAERPCFLCGSSSYQKIIADRLIRTLPENEVFGGKLKIVECRVCGLRYLNPMPNPEDLSVIYNYDVYCDSTNNNDVLQEQFYKLLLEYKPDTKNVLEVGCGTGQFLAYLENQGMHASGVEFADSSRAVRFKGSLYVGKVEEVVLPKNSFDAIFLLNVLEHLVHPEEVLKKIRNTLKKDGILILRHPNSDLLFGSFYKMSIELPKYMIHKILKVVNKKVKFTIVGFQNQHLSYLNLKTTKNILERSGYGIEYCTTMDQYNRQRLRQAFQGGHYIETVIAALRHLMGHAGLGPECVFVARRTT